MKTRLLHLLAMIALSACSTSRPDDLETRFANMSLGLLWLEQSRSRSAVELAHVETELVSRGEFQRGTDFIGKRSSRMEGRALFKRIASATNDYNCDDFRTSLAAQRFFLRAGGPVSDPNDLDRDGDGLACEWGTTLKKYAAQYRPKRVAAPKRVTRPRRTYSNCYTGPRGGTYTITSSGRKNYGGC